jgi:LysM repeat protein
VPCPSCGATNRGSRAQCERCGEPLSPAAVRTAEQQRPGGARTLVPTPVLVLVALAVAAAAVYFLAFSGRGGDGDAPTEASAPSEAADGGAEPEAPAEPASQTYVVAEGDSLSSIAQRFGVTVEALAVANGIDDPDVITLGQELVIPGPVPASPAPS